MSANEYVIINGVRYAAIAGVGVKTVSGDPALLAVVGESSGITKIDINADGYKYIGVAPQGSATSAAVCGITRIDGANPQTIDHSLPAQIYDARKTVSYS